jgi:hypothetical protein
MKAHEARAAAAWLRKVGIDDEALMAEADRLDYVEKTPGEILFQALGSPGSVPYRYLETPNKDRYDNAAEAVRDHMKEEER